MQSAASLPQQLQAIYSQMQSGDVTGARIAVETLLRASVGNAEVLHLCGIVRKQAGDMTGARQAMEGAIAAGLRTPEIRNSLGNILVDMGMFAAADEQFEQAVADNPHYAPVWINRGRLASRVGEHDLAISMLRRAVELSPKSALALGSLGSALTKAGAHKEAVAMYQRAIAQEPGKPVHYINLGNALRNAEQPKNARGIYDTALRSGLATPQLLDSRAATWIDMGEPDRALVEYDELLLRHPDYFLGHKARTRLVWEYGLNTDAFANYRKLAIDYPSEASVWHAWIANAMAYRQYTAVLEICDMAEAARGPDPSYTMAKAIAHSEMGDMGCADDGFQSCAEVFASELDFLNAFSRHLVKRNDPEQAAKISERATKIAPRNQNAWAYLGTAWRMLGDAREDWLHDYDRHVARIEIETLSDPDSRDDFNVKVADTIRSLHRAKHHPAEQSLRGGTQTEGALFDNPHSDIQRLKTDVFRAVRDYVETLPQDDSHPFLRRASNRLYLAGSWSVRLFENGFHINHIHDAGWISSAYYLALPATHSEEQPSAAHLQLGAPPEELGLDLPPRRIIKPQVGTLVLFPSCMWHGTIPYTKQGERLTAAFDVLPWS